MISFKKNNLKSFFSMFLLVFCILFFTSIKVEASIFNLPKLDIVSDGGVAIGPEYTFVPRITKDTKIQTFGSSLWRNTTWSPSDKRAFRSIDVSPTSRDNLKGKIGVRYTKVGNYNGHEIDLKITINNWSRYGNPGRVGTAGRIGSISFERDNIAMSTQGYNWIDTTWEYVRSGTDTRVSVSGYFTFSDIDIRQGVQFSEATSNNIKQFIIGNRNNRLHYSNQNGQYRIFDRDDIDKNDNIYDQDYAFTFLYKDLSTFRFRWMTDWDKSLRNGRLFTPERYFYTDVVNSASGEYFFYLTNKPARTTIPTPTKEVSHTNNFNISQKLNHTIIHEVPQEDPRFYYSNYVIEDTLDSVLTNPKVTVRNQVNKNVTSLFNTSISGNKVKISAKSGTLKSEDFYGERYHITIESSVDRNKLGQAIGSKSEHIINNKATLKANNKTYSTNEVKTKIPKRTITINHIDNDTKKVIQSENRVVFDGESYNVSPKIDLKKENYNYKPINTNAKKGTISGKNVTLDFHYTVPEMTVGIDKIQIYTNKVTTDPLAGLSTNIYLEKDLVKDSKLEDFDGGKVEVKITDKDSNKNVYLKTFNIKDLDDKLQLKLPTNYLSKDKKIQYTVDLSISNNGTKNYKLVSTTPKIETYGYTSSEKVLSNDDIVNDSIKYTGVVMTEKEVDKDIVEYKETLLLDVPNISKQKTGYGFEVKLATTYSNDLKEMEEIKTSFLVDDNLIDSYLQYPSSAGMATISMVTTKQIPSPDGKTISKDFELPHVNMEKNTGNLFTDQQVANNDNKIKHEILDGGRKLYIPIWTDLGIYDYILKSDGPIGVHKVTFDIKNHINVYAYMYGHIDSESIEDDEILITPVDPQNPFPNGKPKNWTDEDVEWLQK